MAIVDIPVKLDEVFFVSAAEDFQEATEDGVPTGEPRTNYDKDAYLLDVQISTYVLERGLKALTSQAVTVEVPVEQATETLKRLHGLPPMTPVVFGSLNVRFGTSQKGKAYQIWTGRDLGLPRAVASVPAQKQATAS